MGDMSTMTLHFSHCCIFSPLQSCTVFRTQKWENDNTEFGRASENNEEKRKKQIFTIANIPPVPPVPPDLLDLFLLRPISCLG